MKPLASFLTTLSLLLFSTTCTHAQWVSVSSNTAETLRDLFFVSPDTGFVVGEFDVLYKTTDGGDTWDDVHFNTLNPLSAIHFPSKNVAYLNGFKTTDMGNTWSPITPANTDGVNSLYFINDTVGFFSYANGVIGKTTNAGLTWINKYLLVSQVYEEFEFTSDSVGYLVGWYGGSIHKTTDQGGTWTLISNMRAYSINFPSQDTGYVVGWYGVIQKTTDAGSTWELQNSGLTQDRRLFDVFCTENNTCYAVGDSGVILKTTDGGLNWIHQYSGTTEELNSIFFTDSNTGFVVGTNGTILKTTNGGELTGVPPICGAQPELSIFPNPASTVLNIECPSCPGFPLVIRIFDSLGREVATFPLPDEKNALNLSAFADGVYCYALLSKNATIHSGKFFKQKRP